MLCYFLDINDDDDFTSSRQTDILTHANNVAQDVLGSNANSSSKFSV